MQIQHHTLIHWHISTYDTKTCWHHQSEFQLPVWVKHEPINHFQNQWSWTTLPKTNITPKNGWLEYDRFLLGQTAHFPNNAVEKWPTLWNARFLLHLHRDHSMTRPPNLRRFPISGQGFDAVKGKNIQKKRKLTFCSPEIGPLSRKGQIYGEKISQKSSFSWWFQPTLKNRLVKLDHFPRDHRVKNQKYLKPQPI